LDLWKRRKKIFKKECLYNKKAAKFILQLFYYI